MKQWLTLCLLLILEVRESSHVPHINDAEFIHECVEMHNVLRGQLSPPASNAQLMTWDEGLAKTARAWAKKCIPEGNIHLEELKTSHPVFNGLGENIWTGPNNEYSATIAIKSWFSESKYYDYENNSCSHICSHYIQVAWDAAYKIGCAFIECPSVGTLQNVAHFICNYVQNGNPRRRPYKAGVFCSECSNKDTCKEMLCSNSIREKIAHYPFWYPRWEVPRPRMCDYRCIFCLVLRLFLFVVNIVIVLLLQHKFPNIRLEKERLWNEIFAEEKEEEDDEI